MNGPQGKDDPVKSLGREALLVLQDEMFTWPFFVAVLYRFTLDRLSKRLTMRNLDEVITLELAMVRKKSKLSSFIYYLR